MSKPQNFKNLSHFPKPDTCSRKELLGKRVITLTHTHPQFKQSICVWEERGITFLNGSHSQQPQLEAASVFLERVAGTVSIISNSFSEQKEINCIWLQILLPMSIKTIDCIKQVKTEERSQDARRVCGSGDLVGTPHLFPTSGSTSNNAFDWALLVCLSYIGDSS